MPVEGNSMADGQQFCTFVLQGQFFGVPVQQVQEVIRFQEMTRVPLVSEVISGLINLRGQIVTAVDLRRCLGMTDRPVGQLPINVVIRTNDGPVSLLVDEIGDVVEVDQNTFETVPETLHGAARAMVHGVYKLPERMLLELDITRTLAAVDPAKESSLAQPINP
jgi:purine-binding chemotaxis protein CheW